MRRCLAVSLSLILMVCLHAVLIHRVSAPPVPYGLTCGLVSDLNPNVHVSQAMVDAVIVPDNVDEENLTHSIDVFLSYNITNMEDHEAYFLTSYMRSRWAPNLVYENNPMNITIQGNSSLYSAEIVYNITNRTELPESICSRYPSSFFSSFFDSTIDVVNLSIAARTNLFLTVQTSFMVECLGDSFDFRYGLDMQKLGIDSTQLDGRVDVSNTSLLVRTNFLNSRSRIVSQMDGSLVATWTLSDWDWASESEYPGIQFDDDVFNEYIGVQLVQSEYSPPGYHLSLESQLLILTLTLATSFTILVALSRRNKLL